MKQPEIHTTFSQVPNRCGHFRRAVNRELIHVDSVSVTIVVQADCLLQFGINRTNNGCIGDRLTRFIRRIPGAILMSPFCADLTIG
jgi:hypothetical protein